MKALIIKYLPLSPNFVLSSTGMKYLISFGLKNINLTVPLLLLIFFIKYYLLFIKFKLPYEDILLR